METMKIMKALGLSRMHAAVITEQSEALQIMDTYLVMADRFNEQIRELADKYNEMNIPLENQEYPDDLNTVVGLYDLKTKSYGCLILDSDREIDCGRLIFEDAVVPFDIVIWNNYGRPDMGIVVQDELDYAINSSAGENVLMLTGHALPGVLIAWDISKSKKKYIRGYKTYRDGFFVSDRPGNGFTRGEEIYHVYKPAKHFRAITGLCISEDAVNGRCIGDEWEKRQLRQVSQQTVWTMRTEKIPNKELMTYIQGIEALNENMVQNMKHEKDYIQLELRLNRLEKLARYGAPRDIIEEELELIRKSLRFLEMI